MRAPARPGRTSSTSATTSNLVRGHLPGRGRHRRDPSRPTRRRRCGSSVRRHRRADRPLRPAHAARWARRWRTSPSTPATHYVPGTTTSQRAIGTIGTELRERLGEFEKQGKLLEAQRLGCAPSTTSRCWPKWASARASRTTAATSTAGQPGRRPSRLLDFFPKDYPRHRSTSPTSPCPSCTDSTPGTARARTCWWNTASACPRPWTTGRCASTSSIERGAARASTSRPRPGAFELEHSAQVVEQVIRPTGLVDPEVMVMPTQGPGRRPASTRIDGTRRHGGTGAR